jgi:hypothetical protein
LLTLEIKGSTEQSMEKCEQSWYFSLQTQMPTDVLLISIDIGAQEHKQKHYIYS